MSDHSECRIKIAPFDLKVHPRCDGKPVSGLKAVCKEMREKGIDVPPYSNMKRDELVQSCCIPSEKEITGAWNGSRWNRVLNSVGRWNDATVVPFPKLEAGREIHVRDGKMSVDSEWMYAFNGDGHWDHMLNGNATPMMGFIANLISEGQTVNIESTCDIEDVGREEETYTVTKDPSVKEGWSGTFGHVSPRDDEPGMMKLLKNPYR